MQLAMPMRQLSCGLCSVYESNAHVESKAYDTRKQTSIESFNFLHTSPVRYQRFFFFDVRRPEISSQIFRNEKNISWCHQHICNQISNNFVSCNEKISHIIRRVFILQLIFMVIFLSYKIFALPKITCRSAGLP